MDKDALLHGPFTRAMARQAGLSDRQLQGKRFVRVMPRVWRHVGHTMTDDDWRMAAALALPARAHLTGISRLQAAGLDYGPRLPVRYVVQGELHLARSAAGRSEAPRLPRHRGRLRYDLTPRGAGCGRKHQELRGRC